MLDLSWAALRYFPPRVSLILVSPEPDFRRCDNGHAFPAQTFLVDGQPLYRINREALKEVAIGGT